MQIVPIFLSTCTGVFISCTRCWAPFGTHLDDTWKFLSFGRFAGGGAREKIVENREHNQFIRVRSLICTSLRSLYGGGGYETIPMTRRLCACEHQNSLWVCTREIWNQRYHISQHGINKNDVNRNTYVHAKYEINEITYHNTELTIAMWIEINKKKVNTKSNSNCQYNMHWHTPRFPWFTSLIKFRHSTCIKVLHVFF